MTIYDDWKRVVAPNAEAVKKALKQTGIVKNGPVYLMHFNEDFLDEMEPEHLEFHDPACPDSFAIVHEMKDLDLLINLFLRR